MSEPRQELTKDELEAVIAFGQYGYTRGNHADAGHYGPVPGPLTPHIYAMQSAVAKLRAAGGQPPSDGMPSEPSDEAIAAYLRAYDADLHHAGAKGVIGAAGALRSGDYSNLRRWLAAAYAAERGVSEGWQNESRVYTTEERALDQRLDRKPGGVSAVPPTEEENE